jgi:hypothetical protein
VGCFDAPESFVNLYRKRRRAVVRTKVLRALSAVSGSRCDPFKSIFVVQTSQDGLSQNSMIPRNRVSRESLHRVARFWYPWSQAGVCAAPVVISHPLLENFPQMSEEQIVRILLC